VPVVRAAIYVRPSYDRDGDMVKVNQQTKIARREITGNGWTEVALYTDNDRSAKEGGTRPGFNRLMDDVQAGKIDVIVAWDHTD
jgi:site-specific DNA recombinase